MSSPPPQSPAYDPSVDTIERQIAAYIAEEDWEDEAEDDDDMDFEPAEEDFDEEFHDASETTSGLEIEFELGERDEGDEDEDEAETGTEADTEAAAATQTAQPVQMSRLQLMQLLGHAGLRRLFANHSINLEADGDDDDYEEPIFGSRRGPSRGARPTGPHGTEAFGKVPNEVGRELMESGEFGTNYRRDDTTDRKRRKKLAYRIMHREMGLGSYGRQRAQAKLSKQDMIPANAADTIIHYGARCYSGQFSADGNFFFSCAQDFKVRMYDTSNPYRWKYYKVVDNPYGSWTITDASLSIDNRYLAYSSISRMVCLAPTDPNVESEPVAMDFSNMGSGVRRGRGGYTHFGIWSIRFSGDGRELVAGTGDHSVYVYDIERQQSVLRIPGHSDDVNAVCFASSASPHILFSGSDDTTLKVWDRRSMASNRAAGVFLGHTEGVTYVDSKDDGRYLISNGKEQCAKLWDLRKVVSTEEAEKVDINRYTTGYDYRNNSFPIQHWRPHPHDCSIVTFRGHAVVKTLIRCHFSPLGSTDSRYVYSGSYDGSVYVWNMDATLAGKIDVAKATKNARVQNTELSLEADGFFGWNGYQTCVRDASWHPDAPIIAATAWNGWGTSLGTCTVHSWNDGMEDDEGEPKMGLSVDPQLDSVEVGEEGQDEGSVTRARSARLRRRMWSDD